MASWQVIFDNHFEKLKTHSDNHHAHASGELAEIKKLLKEIHRTMATQADVDALKATVDTLTASANQTAEAVGAANTKLEDIDTKIKALIAAGSGGTPLQIADLATSVAAAQAAMQTLGTAVSKTTTDAGTLEGDFPAATPTA